MRRFKFQLLLLVLCWICVIECSSSDVTTMGCSQEVCEPCDSSCSRLQDVTDFCSPDRVDSDEVPVSGMPAKIEATIHNISESHVYIHAAISPPADHTIQYLKAIQIEVYETDRREERCITRRLDNCQLNVSNISQTFKFCIGPLRGSQFSLTVYSLPLLPLSSDPKVNQKCVAFIPRQNPHLCTPEPPSKDHPSMPNNNESTISNEVDDETDAPDQKSSSSRAPVTSQPTTPDLNILYITTGVGLSIIVILTLITVLGFCYNVSRTRNRFITIVKDVAPECTSLDGDDVTISTPTPSIKENHELPDSSLFKASEYLQLDITTTHPNNNSPPLETGSCATSTSPNQAGRNPPRTLSSVSQYNVEASSDVIKNQPISCREALRDKRTDGTSITTPSEASKYLQRCIENEQQLVSKLTDSLQEPIGAVDVGVSQSQSDINDTYHDVSQAQDDVINILESSVEPRSEAHGMNMSATEPQSDINDADSYPSKLHDNMISTSIKPSHLHIDMNNEDNLCETLSASNDVMSSNSECFSDWTVGSYDSQVPSDIVQTIPTGGRMQPFVNLV